MDLESILNNPPIFKTEDNYVDDRINQIYVASSRLDGRPISNEEIIEDSNNLVRSRITKDTSDYREMYLAGIEYCDKEIAHNQKLEDRLNRKLTKQEKFINYTELNPNIQPSEKGVAYIKMAFAILLVLMTAFCEIWFMRLYVGESIGGEGSVLSELGKVGEIIIGLIPSIVMALGFFLKNTKPISIKLLLISEAVWIILFATTLFSVGGVATLAEAITKILNIYFFSPILGLLMVVTQSLMLTAIGFNLWKWVRESVDSLRLINNSINPAWKRINDEMTDIRNSISYFTISKGKLKGFIVRIDSFIEEVISLNKISISRHIKVLEPIDNIISHIEDKINLLDKAKKELIKELNIASSIKLAYQSDLIEGS